MKFFFSSCLSILALLSHAQTYVFNDQHHETDSYELSFNAYATLDTIVNIMRAKPALQLEISGHTDSIGTAAHNIKLSHNRAQTAANYIILKGIDKNRVTYNGYGSTKPIMPNNTIEGRAKNRRVEFRIFEDKSKAVAKPATKPQPIIPSKKESPSVKATLSGTITNKETNKPLPGILILKLGDSTITRINIDETGKYLLKDINLKPFSNYDLVANSPKYFFGSTTFLSSVFDKKSEQTYDFQLEPIKVNQSYTLSNINFYPDKATVLPSALSALNSLLNFMQENTSVSIEIIGHTNGAGSSSTYTDHVALSNARAETVYQYLVRNRIDPDRMDTRGMGCSKMLYPKATTLAEAKQNMRVEIKITAVE